MNDLNKYLPRASINLVNEWINRYKCEVKIRQPRKSKLGDYHFCVKSKKHKISINNNLNKYLFLITLTHEIAHMMVWEKNQNNVLPHGKEWKTIFKKLMLNFLHIFPNEINKNLSIHLKNPKSSTCYDIKLSNSLRQFNSEIRKTVVDIPEGSFFTIHNGQKFIKIKKLRKRYYCKCINNNRFYTFSPLTEIL